MNGNEIITQVEKGLLKYYGFVEITTKTIKQQDDPFSLNFRSRLRNSPVIKGLIYYKTKFFTKRKPKDSPGGHQETFFLLKSKSSLYLIICLPPPYSTYEEKFQRRFLLVVKKVIAPKLLTATYQFQKRKDQVYEFWYPPDPFEHFRRSQLEKLQRSGEITNLNLKTDL